MNEEHSLCFLCCSFNSAKTYYTTDKIESNSHLSNNLDVIFLLRNLLQIPISQLERQLKECGSNPESWLSLCNQCNQLIRNSRKLQYEMQKIRKQLVSIQCQVLENIRQQILPTANEDDGNDKEEGIFYHPKTLIPFSNEVKCFVKTHDYKCLNEDNDDDSTFLEGDKLANYLKSQGKISNTLLLFDKSFVPEEIKVEVDLPPISSEEGTTDFDNPSSPETAPQVELNISRKRKEKLFTCEICAKKFSSYLTLYRHRRTLHKNEKIPKDMNRSTIISDKLEGTKLACSLCNKKFKCKKYLEDHIKQVHKKQYDVTCHLCGIGLQNKNKLKMHLLGKHRNDPIAKQMEEEQGIKNIKCPVVGCISRFLRQSAVDQHVDRCHGGNKQGLEEIDKRFKCQFCGKGFWDGTKLKHHERIHEGMGKEDWKCEICGKGYSTKQYLRYHQLHTHKQSKKFQQS